MLCEVNAVALPAMTGAEMKTAREFLGLTTSWLSNEMTMNERRMQRMEADQESIPDALVSKLDEISAETKDEVTRLIAVYRRKVKASDETVKLVTYRTDEKYSAAGGTYPSRWHRMICARVAEAVPGLVLVYEEVA